MEHADQRITPRFESSQLPLFCPSCGESIEIQRGLGGRRQNDAILYQVHGLGSELTCSHCHTRFICRIVDEISDKNRRKNNRPNSAVKLRRPLDEESVAG